MPRENGDMWDIGCIAASVAFFIVAIAYIAGCDRLGNRGEQMTLEALLLSLVALALLVYLVYALLRPENF